MYKSTGWTVLHAAALDKKEKVVVQLLKHKDILVNSASETETTPCDLFLT